MSGRQGSARGDAPADASTGGDRFAPDPRAAVGRCVEDDRDVVGHHRRPGAEEPVVAAGPADDHGTAVRPRPGDDHRGSAGERPVDDHRSAGGQQPADDHHVTSAQPADHGSAGGTTIAAHGSVAAPLSFQPRTGLKYLAGFFAGGVGLSVLYATTGQGIPCPLRSITGWECPLCGGTRLGGALLRGDVAAAFTYNPLIFIGLVGLTVAGVLWIVEAIGGPRIRPPARLAARLRQITPTRWLIVGLVVSLGYVLLRNLL